MSNPFIFIALVIAIWTAQSGIKSTASKDTPTATIAVTQPVKTKK